MQASWIPHLVLFYLPASYFITQNVLSWTVGGSFVCKPDRALWLPRPCSGGTLLVLASLLLLRAATANRGCFPPAAIGMMLLAICVFPDLVGVCLFKNQVGVSECCPCFVWSVITLAQVLLAQVPAATEKVATKSIAGQGGAARLRQETGTGMEVQEPEQTEEKRSWYIFFFLDNRTGLTQGGIRMLGITFLKTAV